MERLLLLWDEIDDLVGYQPLLREEHRMAIWSSVRPPLTPAQRRGPASRGLNLR